MLLIGWRKYSSEYGTYGLRKKITDFKKGRKISEIKEEGEKIYEKGEREGKTGIMRGKEGK